MGDKKGDGDKTGDTVEDTITITMRDAVRGNTAMRTLSARPIKGTTSYLISKAARQVNPQVEDYHKGMRGIMEDAGAEPDSSGNLTWQPGSEGFKDGRKAVEAYEKKHLDEKITIKVRPIKLEELLDGILPIKDDDGKETREGGVIEPFILEGLGWMIEE